MMTAANLMMILESSQLFTGSEELAAWRVPTFFIMIRQSPVQMLQKSMTKLQSFKPTKVGIRQEDFNEKQKP